MSGGSRKVILIRQDATNAFKIYRREVIDGIQPILSHHFNLTVELLIDLFWVGDTKIVDQDFDFYTAYVHLLDEKLERISGFDVALAPEYVKNINGRVFMSRHELVKPPNLSDGVYSLAVGLYHFEDDGLVNEATTILDKAVRID